MEFGSIDDKHKTEELDMEPLNSENALILL